MAKILFTSDLHLTKDLLRITECLNFLDYIKKYCAENDIEYLVLGGDLFHQANSIKNQSFIPFFNKLFELSKELKMYIFVGNHEAMNKERDSLLEVFKPFSHFIKDSETINIDGVDYDFLSYSENPEDIPNKGQVLFTHLEVEGFYYNPYQKSENKTFTKNSFDQYELVVSGHIHKMQEEGNIVFPGSPYATNKGEANNHHHYFAVVDGTKCDLVEYSEAPDYITVNLEEALTDKTIDYNNNIVEVVINSKIENFVKLRDIIISKGGIDVIPKFEKSESTDMSNRTKIDANEGVAVSMVKYLKETKKTGIDNEKLLKCFKNVLKRVKE